MWRGIWLVIEDTNRNERAVTPPSTIGRRRRGTPACHFMMCAMDLTSDPMSRLQMEAFHRSRPVPRARGRTSRLTVGVMFSALAVALSSCASGGNAPPVQGARIDLRGLPVPEASQVANREQTADQQVIHSLNRLAFGARPGDVEAVRELGVDRWIAAQLEPVRIANPAADSALARYSTLSLSLPALLGSYPPNPNASRIERL